MGYLVEYNPMFYAFVATTLFSDFMFGSLSISFLFRLYRILKTGRNRFAESTYQMQMMLFRVVTLSIIAYVIFLTIPLASILLLRVLNVQKYGALLVCLFVFMVSMHSLIDYIILLYFTTSYRKFCVKCFNRVFFFIAKFKNSNSVVIVSSQILSNQTAHTV